MSEQEFTPAGIPLEKWIQLNQELYKEPLDGLREVIQNAIDATRMSDVTTPKTAKISIRTIQEDGRQYVVVADNGIGMTRDVVEKHFWVPGEGKKGQLPVKQRAEKRIIGKFGIGGYACFIFSDEIYLASKYEGGGNAAASHVKIRRSVDEQGHELIEPKFTTEGLKLPTGVPHVFRRLMGEEVLQNLSHGTVLVYKLTASALGMNAGGIERMLNTYCDRISESIVLNGKPQKFSHGEVPAVEKYEVRKRGVADRELKEIEFRSGLTAEGDFAIRVDGVRLKRGTIEQRVSCDGCLQFKKGSLGPSIKVYKYDFLHASITKAPWSYLGEKDTYLHFAGYLDLPFVEPDLNRAGLNAGTDRLVKKLLHELSEAVLTNVAQSGSQIQKYLDVVCHFASDSRFDAQKREAVFGELQLKKFGTDGYVTVRELLDRKECLKGIRFLTTAAPEKVRIMAASLAREDDQVIVEIPDSYWEKSQLSTMLKELVGAENLEEKASIQRPIPPEEMDAAWQSYQGVFKSVLARFWSQQSISICFSEIIPSEIKLVYDHTKTPAVVHANLTNPEVRALAESRIQGAELKKLLRAWVYGAVQSKQIEADMIRMGQLVVFQSITEVRFVTFTPKIVWMPKSDDRFVVGVHESDGSVRHFLRVPPVITEFVESYVGPTGEFRDEAYSAEFLWLGNRFGYRFVPKRGDLPEALVSFLCGFPLKRPDDLGYKGELPLRQAFRAFPDAEGIPVHFFILPDWIGERIRQEIESGRSINLETDTGEFLQSDEAERDVPAEPD